MIDASKLRVSFEIRDDKMIVRYGPWVHEYELDADPGDVSRFVGSIIKMNIEKYQRRVLNEETS